jgi:hypothetical protein
MPVILATQEVEIRRIMFQLELISWAISSQETLSQKKKNQKGRAGGVAQGVGPEFRPQYCKKEKKIN